MLFKILKGDSSRISTDVTPFHEGYAYVTANDGGFYIDMNNGTADERIRINPQEVPAGGSAGQVLTKTADGAEWKDAPKPTSVDGMSGGTLTSDLKVGNSGLGTNGYVKGTWLQSTANIAMSTAAPKIAVLSGDGWIYSRTPAQIKSDIGLGNVDNVKQYSADNPPPYPVTSVNGKTGAVTVNVPTVPTTTTILKGNGSGGLVAATAGTDYMAVPTARKVTLTTAGWNSSTNQQTVSVSGVLADRTKQAIHLTPIDTSLESVWNTCGIQAVAQAANSLTFQCTKIPTAAVGVDVVFYPVKYVS